MPPPTTLYYYEPPPPFPIVHNRRAIIRRDGGSGSVPPCLSLGRPKPKKVEKKREAGGKKSEVREVGTQRPGAIAEPPRASVLPTLDKKTT